MRLIAAALCPAIAVALLVMWDPDHPGFRYWLPFGDRGEYAAARQARATWKQFAIAVAQPKAGQSEFLIRTSLISGNPWIGDVSFDGTSFRGRGGCRFDPATNSYSDEWITVVPEQLCDWRYIENGKLIGGFTLRALWQNSSPRERRKLELRLNCSF